MRILLALAAALEVALGLALIIDPSVVARLLLGEGVSGTAVALGRVAGCGFVAFGIACWPGTERLSNPAALRGLLCYNLLVTIYLASLGIDGASVGILLWPVVALHAVLTCVLARAWLNVRSIID